MFSRGIATVAHTHTHTHTHTSTHMHARTVHGQARALPLTPADERRRSALNGFREFYLKATARISPEVSYVCQIRSEAS